ncbi:hypothetical protein HanPI659440_Chr04g0143671 [Helianthus annuus]|nr:hypothetical protein HanPI659440_Chr04g0143671 [Helianthus annuus]
MLIYKDMVTWNCVCMDIVKTVLSIKTMTRNLAIYFFNQMMVFVTYHPFKLVMLISISKSILITC